MAGAFGLIALLCLTGALAAAESHCLAYPAGQRSAQTARLQLERAFAARARKPASQRAAIPSANFIDDYVFGKMAADGVEPAPLADDATFLRRASLDLTGRIPSPEQVKALGDPGALIESLMASPAFVDYWTLFYGNIFKVVSNYYRYVGIPGRNLFHAYLRDFVARDRSYRDVVTELITAIGDSHRAGPPNFIMRGIQQGDPIQDTWDTLTNEITTEFLGIQTQCVSCHDGRRHLEQINLYLADRRRDEFMRLSAFLARMQITELNVDAFNQQRKGIIADLPAGVYHGVVNPQNPGARPPRVGTFEPVYMFTGEQPRSGAWRREFARLIVNDRQFARATVNYLWAHFFQVGIVDPPTSWDLARIDPKNPPPAPWTLQPSHPELIEALADEFIRGGYRLRPILRLLAQSAAYQLSSRYAGEWKPVYASYFAKHFPRRLGPEEAYDALARATMTETPMYVEGFNEPLLNAVQLPDPSEPRANTSVFNLLTSLGRGDWWRTPRSTEGSVVQSLYLMNDNNVNQRTFGNQRGNSTAGSTRVARLVASSISDEDAVRQLFLATLGRRPTDTEMGVAIRSRRANREDWLTDVQWSLINKTEFLFNH